MTTTTDVSCPNCGQISRIDPAARSAQEFCPNCDYPLFWAVEPAPAETDGGEGLRRLPGMAGARTIGAVICPACSEHNGLFEVYCIRCGAELHPEPVAEVEAEPEPEPEPVVEIIRPPIGPMWPWYLLYILLPVVILLVLVAVVG